jgi:hypothetical protein
LFARFSGPLNLDLGARPILRVDDRDQCEQQAHFPI